MVRMSEVRPSVLSRRNPTVKLALLFSVSVVLLFVFDPVTPAVLYLLALTATLAAAVVPLRTLALAHIPFVGFAFGMLLVNAVSRPGRILFDIAGLSVSLEGLQVGGSLALRTLLIGVLSIAFITSTDGVALMTSLHQHARLGPRVTYAVLAGYRMLQQMPAEWRTIRQAHAVRMPLRRDGRLPRDLRSFGRAAFGLLVVSLRKGERMALSLESRGLGLSPRTTWRPVALDWRDAAFAATVLAVIAVVLGVSALAGTLGGFGRLSA